MVQKHSQGLRPAAMGEGLGDFVLYDGDCPVCQNFVSWTRLRAIRPEVQLIDARQAPELVAEFRAVGIDVNDTMVLRLGDLTLDGADAFSAISALGSPDPGVRTMLMKLIAKKRLAGPLYPVLVAARKLLLALLRKQQIR